MSRHLNKEELVEEIRVALVKLFQNSVVDGFVARVEGLIGVTLGNDNVFLINIREDFDKFAKYDFEKPQQCITNSRLLDARQKHFSSVEEMNEINLNSHFKDEAGPKDRTPEADTSVRYGANMFDSPFSQDAGKKRERRTAVGSCRVDHQDLSLDQNSRCVQAMEHNKDSQVFQKFVKQSISAGKEFPYRKECQLFSVKEEPATGADDVSDDMAANRDMVSMASFWPPGKSNKELTMSYRKSSGLRLASSYSNSNLAGQGKDTDNSVSDRLNADEDGPLMANEAVTRAGFVQQPWLARSYDHFQASNGVGEIYEHRPFVCELCDASFTKKFCLANHIVTIHQVGGKYVCKHCGKQFLQKLRYLTHVDRHNNIRRHVCQMCGKAFSYKYSLWSHAKKCIGDVSGDNAAYVDDDGSNRIGGTAEQVMSEGGASVNNKQ